MKVVIKPSQLKNWVQAPASKSSMQRALAAAFLSGQTCHLFNPGHSNDDEAAISIITALGARVEKVKDQVVIVHPGGTKSDMINCGESGLSIRMFAPVAALENIPVTITGEGSLLSRPMDFFDEVFPQLGVTIESNDGKLPISIKGPLQPKNITIDGSLSSQFLTGLLMAYAAAGADGLCITVKNLKSRPYIDLTISIMRHFGLAMIENNNYETFYFHAIDRKAANKNYMVEGDWSGAAFLLVAGAIAGPVRVKGLDLSSTQADKAIIDAMMSANAGIAMDAKGIVVHPGSMNGFSFDATDCPDLFPPLVALAAYCEGRTTIKGVNRLLHKESNRSVSLQEEFGKMGVNILVDDDTMIIEGGSVLKGANVHSRHDHRIAMACAVAALKAEGTTTIDAAEAINKSYPDFFEDLKKLGADVSLNNKIKLHE